MHNCQKTIAGIASQRLGIHAGLYLLAGRRASCAKPGLACAAGHDRRSVSSGRQHRQHGAHPGAKARREIRTQLHCRESDRRFRSDRDGGREARPARWLHSGFRRFPADFGSALHAEDQLRSEQGLFLCQHFWRRPLCLRRQFRHPRQVGDRLHRLCERQAGGDDICIRRHFLGNAPRRRAVFQKSRTKSRSRTISRRRPRCGGAARRASSVLLRQCVGIDPAGEQFAHSHSGDFSGEAPAATAQRTGNERALSRVCAHVLERIDGAGANAAGNTAQA